MTSSEQAAYLLALKQIVEDRRRLIAQFILAGAIVFLVGFALGYAASQAFG